MIAWALGRAASSLARAFGADSEDAAAIGLGVGSLLVVVDPVGAAINAAHSTAQAHAKTNDVAKGVNIALSCLVVGDVLSELPDVINGGPSADKSSIA